ncbi:MAG: aldehyde dehydrogenase [bacterium]|nr:aldehyde dehydrogenase [bacterium]
MQIKNYINGELLAPVDGSYIDNIDPSRGKVYSEIPRSNSGDLQTAVAGAKEAFRDWSTASIEARSRVLLKISEGIEARMDDLVAAESKDNGKPLSLARKVDIPRAAANFRFFANAIVNFSSQAHVMEDVAVNYTRRAPLGVVGCISPWNLPLYLFTWKIAPALAMGNCVIAKPSELTPMTAFLLSEICIEAGLPKGVLNIVHGFGYEIGEEIVKHPDIKAISFTGGTQTGKIIASITGPMFKKASLELGGKNPAIILEDCEFDHTVKEMVRASFSNQGEICLCASRIFVQRSIYNKFRDAFVAEVAKLKVSNPEDETTNLGALVSEAHLNKVQGYVDLAKSEGGTILQGGNRKFLEGEYSEGYYFEPTVIEGLSNSCRTNQEEIFGPVVTLMPFDTVEEAVELGNDTTYGLAATIWTTNLKLAHNIGHQIQAGIIWINTWLLRDLRTPFGGMKSSGVGREGGEEALRFFSEPQNICVKL